VTRYFVDLVLAGEVSADQRGMELPNIEAVRMEAEATIRDFAAESRAPRHEFGDGEIRVRDTEGREVLALKFRDVIS